MSHIEKYLKTTRPSVKLEEATAKDLKLSAELIDDAVSMLSSLLPSKDIAAMKTISKMFKSGDTDLKKLETIVRGIGNSDAQGFIMMLLTKANVGIKESVELEEAAGAEQALKELRDLQAFLKELDDIAEDIQELPASTRRTLAGSASRINKILFKL